MRIAALSGLAVLFLACSAPQAQQSPATRDAVKPAGDLPAGWKARLDTPAAGSATSGVTAEHEALTFANAPAGIYYKPGMNAEKGYTVSATFSQLKPTAQPIPYGLFIAGTNLDKDDVRYTALLIRADGKFQIVSRQGSKETAVVGWMTAPPMMEPKGVKTSNTLTIRALEGAVHFLINDKEVQQMPRTAVGGDGLAGLRIGGSLNLQVAGFAAKKFP